jgi:imidazole glycerol-phosphate synthase subunit HisF
MFEMPAKNPYKKGGMFDGAGPLIFGMAKDLRKNMTDAEKVLWFHLKQNPEGFKFRRQHPLGIYIADFYCHKAKLVIELDGSIHDNEEVKTNDEIRQRNIEEGGIKVIRFKNEEIFNDIETVLRRIESHLIT